MSFSKIDCYFDGVINQLDKSHIWGQLLIQRRRQTWIFNKKKPLPIAQIRESILWASPGLNSVLIPSDRHFIFNNNHLLLRLCALSNLAVGGHSIPTWLAGGWLCVIGEPSVSRQIRSASSALLSRSSSGLASFVICVLWTNGLSESRASVHLRLFLFAPSGWQLAPCQRLQTEMTRHPWNGNVPLHISEPRDPKRELHAEKWKPMERKENREPVWTLFTCCFICPTEFSCFCKHQFEWNYRK